MTYRHVWWLDPGKTSGLSTYDLETGEFTAAEYDFQATCRKLLDSAKLEGGVQIGSESFTITVHTAKNSQAPWSLELIGVARMISEIWHQRPLLLQAPAIGKRFSSDARLKQAGFWTAGKGGHANDSSRHLLVFLATRRHLSAELLESFVTE